MERPLGTIEQPHVLPIERIVDESTNVKTFFFKATLHSRPGQFVILWIPRLDEKPFSIAYDDQGLLGLSIARVGPFTEKLFTFRTGDKVGLRGPYGSHFRLATEAKRILLIGGGYGVAPLAALAAEAKKDGIVVDFCNGARSAEQILFKKRLEQMKVNLHLTTDDGSSGQHGLVTEAAGSCLEKDNYDSAYICGPELMEKAAVELCVKHHLPCQVSIERYMKCGFGLCGQCCLDGSGERMCVEGPVVSGEYALAQTEFGRYHRDKSGKKLFYGHHT